MTDLGVCNGDTCVNVLVFFHLHCLLQAAPSYLMVVCGSSGKMCICGDKEVQKDKGHCLHLKKNNILSILSIWM